MPPGSVPGRLRARLRPMAARRLLARANGPRWATPSPRGCARWRTATRTTRARSASRSERAATGRSSNPTKTTTRRRREGKKGDAKKGEEKGGEEGDDLDGLEEEEEDDILGDDDQYDFGDGFEDGMDDIDSGGEDEPTY